MTKAKYKTLAEFKAAIDSKDPLVADTFLIIDNDSTTVYSDIEDDDGKTFLLFDGGMPEDLLKEALDLLGIPNEPA